MNATRKILPGIAFCLLTPGLLAGDDDGRRIMRKEIIIEAPLEQVWHAWTTAEGLSIVSPKSNIELRVGGPYEWFLQGEPDAQGRVGSEGCRVLAFLPGEVLAFDWTFPPELATLRAEGARTQVVVQFDAIGPDRVRVRFAQHGWGRGEEWDRGYAYFDEAWDWVLNEIKSNLEGSNR